MAEYSEDWLDGPSSTRFYTRTYPAEAPKAVLVFQHGSAEHVGRHAHSHVIFARRGVTVFTYDLRGYGRTAQDREHKSAHSSYGKTSWKDQIDDLQWAIEHAHHQFPELPMFLMGFSSGGTLALSFVMRQSLKPSVVSMLSGVIAVAPTVHLTFPPPKWFLWVTTQISRITPYAVIPGKHRPESLSRNPLTNQAYKDDPLIGSPGRLRIIGDLLATGDQLLEKDFVNWPEDLPIFIMQGDKDEKSAPKSTEALYDKLRAKDKRLVMYSGAHHELHNEPDGVKERFPEDCITLIDSYIRQDRVQGDDIDTRRS